LESLAIKAKSRVARLLDNVHAVWPHGLRSRPIILAALTACGVIPNYEFADAKSPAHARAAHVLSGNENATLHLVHANGSTLYEEGRTNGSLPGTVHAWLHIGATFTGRFVFYTRSGAISGHGTAKSHQGRYPYVSFSGTANITSGSHRYIHVRGSLGFYGVLNRDSSSVQMQTRGTLTY
jgi:hypothetical protein